MLNRTFFKLSLGFLIIIGIGIASIFFAENYDSRHQKETSTIEIPLEAVGGN